MKTFLQFISNRDYSYRCVHFYCCLNQLHSNSLLSRQAHPFRSFSLNKNLKENHMSKVFILHSRKCLTYKTFSTSINFSSKAAAAGFAGSAPLPEENGNLNFSVNKNETLNVKNDQVSSINDIDEEFKKKGKKLTLIGESDPPNVLTLINKLKELVASNERNIVQINIICNTLEEMNLNLSAKECSNLLYYLSALNIPKEELLLKIGKHLFCKLNEIYKPDPLLISIPKSLSKLLYRDLDLLNGLINWFHNNMTSVEPCKAIETIHTLAVLNYFPGKAEVLIKEIINDCKVVGYQNSLSFLNFVWALTLLDRADENLVATILSNEFRKRMETLLVRNYRLPFYIKLHNINGYASVQMPNVKREVSKFLNDGSWLVKIKEQRQKDPCIKSLIDSLSYLLPLRCLNCFVQEETGSIIDAVCFYDKKNEPISEYDFMKNQNGQKIAFIVLGFKDLCLPGKVIPTGVLEFHKRFLEAKGYKVIFIPFNEFPVKENLKHKSEYLTKKIQDALTNLKK